MTITYETSGVVTSAGITAAIEAGASGPQINVSGYKIGSNSNAQGAVAVVTDTDVDGLVYQGTSAGISYVQVDADTVVWTIRMDTTIGNFEIGNVGLVLEDGTLFCKAVLPGQVAKWEDGTPGQNGDTIFINILLRLANVANLLSTTLLDTSECSLPEVPTEIQLPAADTTPYNAWMVDNHTHAGVPTTALRLNDAWWHAPHRAAPGQGQGVLVVLPTTFNAGTPNSGLTAAPALGPVGWDAESSTFVAADADDSAHGPVGIRTSSFQVTTLGIVPAAACGYAGPLTPLTFLYAGASSTGNIGQLSPVENGPALAAVLPNGDLWIDCSRLWLGDESTDACLADILALVTFESRQRLFLSREVDRGRSRDFALSMRLTNANL